MAAPTALELGRSAVADRRWAAAAEWFADAQRDDPSALTVHDLEGWSTALFLRGERNRATEALTTAHDSSLARGDLAGAARAAGVMSIQLLEAGEVAGAGVWGARGMRLAEQLDEANHLGAMVALVPTAFGAMFVGDIADAIRRFDRIAAVADRFGDADLAAHAAFGRGMCLTMQGRVAEGFASLDAAMEPAVAGRLSSLTTCVVVRMTLDVAHRGFDLERAERWTTGFARWCDAQPELVAYTGQAHAYRAELATLHGAWADASAHAARADESLRAGDFTAEYVANYRLAELHRLRGELHAAEDHYRRAARTGWDPQPGLALARLAAGDAAGAQSMIRNAAAGVDDTTRQRLLPAMVRIELAAGDVAAARRAADELAEAARAVPTPLFDAVAALAAARVLHAEGRTSDALGELSTARAAFAAIDAPYGVAQCRLLEGRIRRDADGPDAGRAPLEAARRGFVELGARLDVVAIDALDGQRSVDALTAREIEVLRLVTTGLTNRGVADRLSLSEKTVARHLSNIYGKLRLSSRAAATAWAYQQGIV